MIIPSYIVELLRLIIDVGCLKRKGKRCLFIGTVNVEQIEPWLQECSMVENMIGEASKEGSLSLNISVR